MARQYCLLSWSSDCCQPIIMALRGEVMWIENWLALSDGGMAVLYLFEMHKDVKLRCDGQTQASISRICYERLLKQDPRTAIMGRISLKQVHRACGLDLLEVLNFQSHMQMHLYLTFLILQRLGCNRSLFAMTGASSVHVVSSQPREGGNAG